MITSDSNILKNRIKLFCEYLDNIYIIDDWKKQLVDPKRIGIQTQVYLYYPELFWYAFNEPKSNTEILDKLCISGYLYFNSLILQDKLLDDNKKYIHTLPLISFLQEETIKILVGIFPSNSPFWERWHTYRKKYVDSIATDKSVSETFNLANFECFAVSKSIYAQIAIDSSYFASNRDPQRTSIHEKLVKSHEHFSVGLQILDDLSDIEEDFNNNQKNIIITRCRELADKSNASINSVNQLKKIFYISGCAEEVLNNCLNYFLNAKKEVAGIENLDLWISSIDSQMLKTFRIATNINIYNKEVHAKTYFSNEILQAETIISDRVKLTEEFIYNQQDDDGSWSDMITNQGVSKVWATAFVAWNLSQNSSEKDPRINKAINYILQNRSVDLWGYNSNWLSDIDSSSNALLALFFNNLLDINDLNTWCGWQKPNGSFSTYTTDERLKFYLGNLFDDFSGWTYEHTCVSAFAYYILCIIDSSLPARKNLLDFLLKNQEETGLWNSYWWTSPIFATAFIIKGLIIDSFETHEHTIEKAIDAMLRLKNDNHSFGCKHSKESAFYTLLVLDTLCASEKVFNKYSQFAKLILKWVSENQLTDGSFHSSNILQVPSPDEKKPWLVKEWKTNNQEGVNVVRNDFMRLFTTSIAHQSLKKYLLMSKIDHYSKQKV